MNVVLPWEKTKIEENFQPKDITLEDPEYSLRFPEWEKNDYDPKLRMKLSAYREDIWGRQTSLRRLWRFSTQLSFMLGTQFSCVATPNTRFQIAIDKHMFHQKANSYQRKELLIEGDDEAPSTKMNKES